MILTRDDNVEDKADILPRSLDLRYISDECPHLLILCVDIDYSFSHELHGLCLLDLEVGVFLTLKLSHITILTSISPFYELFKLLTSQPV